MPSELEEQQLRLNLKMKVKKKVGSFESFDKTKIHYEVLGEGSPLIFLPGVACPINHWHHQIEHFSKSYQAVSFYYRGHCLSGTPYNKDNLNIESLTKDLECLLQTLEIETACFLSHSFGGQIIIEAYRHFSEKFSSIVFLNSFVKNPIQDMFNGLAHKLFSSAEHLYQLLPRTSSYIWRKMTDENPLLCIIFGLAGGFNLNLTHFKDIEIYTKTLSTIELETLIRLLKSLMNYDGSHWLGEIQVPTLIIGGQKDLVTPTHHQTEMKRYIPESELTLIPYGSHCCQLDFPDFVNIRIEKFLNDKKISLKKRQAHKS